MQFKEFVDYVEWFCDGMLKTMVSCWIEMFTGVEMPCFQTRAHLAIAQ
jgi:hypothetical protein